MSRITQRTLLRREKHLSAASPSMAGPPGHTEFSSVRLPCLLSLKNKLKIPAHRPLIMLLKPLLDELWHRWISPLIWHSWLFTASRRTAAIWGALRKPFKYWDVYCVFKVSVTFNILFQIPPKFLYSTKHQYWNSVSQCYTWKYHF